MAQKETWTKLFAPDGSPVEVLGEDRADVLKSRGYTTSKPRAPKPSAKPGESDEVAALREQLAKAEQERDEAVALATKPTETGEAPKK